MWGAPFDERLGSVVFSFCRASPAQPFSDVSLTGLMSVLGTLYLFNKSLGIHHCTNPIDIQSDQCHEKFQFQRFLQIRVLHSKKFLARKTHAGFVLRSKVTHCLEFPYYLTIWAFASHLIFFSWNFSTNFFFLDTRVPDITPHPTFHHLNFANLITAAV
jgi:hypothetical protein